VRFGGQAFQQRGREAGFSNPGFTAEQHHLAFTSLFPAPALLLQFKFFRPYKGSQAGRP
jgi:hypothetical protein